MIIIPAQKLSLEKLFNLEIVKWTDMIEYIQNKYVYTGFGDQIVTNFGATTATHCQFHEDELKTSAATSWAIFNALIKDKNNNIHKIKAQEIR